MKLTTSEQMRTLDQRAIGERKIPSLTLMERAAEGVCAAGLELLADCLPGVRVMRNEDLGLDSNAKEAVAFAILANEYLFQHCGNVCRVTGAKHPVVLGKMSL